MAKTPAKPVPPKKTVGRYVDPVTRGRITVRRPTSAKKSPKWYGWTIIGLMVLGILIIILNYLDALPGATSAWYLAGGLASIFIAFYLATGYK
ncbi:MAG: cell division protein CrgA [Acidimicrobiales bacterium]